MTMRETIDWEVFYQKIAAGRTPRPLLKNVLERFAADPERASRQAIDLGCGDGTETAVLLADGWQVLAIDGEAAAIEQLLAKVPADARDRLQTQVANFEDVELPPTDLIYASLSIPFCHPKHFDAFWAKIVDSIKSGGRFAGEFYGVKDTWTMYEDMTFHTEKQVRTLLEAFEIEYFDEEDEDGYSTEGAKHWHVFTVVARKK